MSRKEYLLNVLYEHMVSYRRGYRGIGLDEPECLSHLQKNVKDNILDRSEREDTLNRLVALKDETGFDLSPGLEADIKSLENEKINVNTFRVAEALSEVILEQEYSCRFHWNENRDTRNPKGNKTGADIVGFIEVEDQVLFLFGEVKSSSETLRRPPQVMTGRAGMEKQLEDLYKDRSKRHVLITYLKSKMRHFPEGHKFKTDFELSQKAYYSKDKDYHLIGVLVRDVEPDERDISVSYKRLIDLIKERQCLKLLAIYLPISKENWIDIINERVE